MGVLPGQREPGTCTAYLGTVGRRAPPHSARAAILLQVAVRTSSRVAQLPSLIMLNRRHPPKVAWIARGHRRDVSHSRLFNRLGTSINEIRRPTQATRLALRYRDPLRLPRRQGRRPHTTSDPRVMSAESPALAQVQRRAT